MSGQPVNRGSRKSGAILARLSQAIPNMVRDSSKGSGMARFKHVVKNAQNAVEESANMSNFEEKSSNVGSIAGGHGVVTVGKLI